MIVIIGLLLVCVFSAIGSYLIALKKGLNPVLWAAMGAMFGPFAIGVALIVEPKTKDRDSQA